MTKDTFCDGTSIEKNGAKDSTTAHFWAKIFVFWFFLEIFELRERLVREEKWEGEGGGK